MKKKPLLKLLFLSLPFFALTPAHALDPSVHISQYGHRKWTMQDGTLGGGMPTAIAQTGDGYLWFGTQSGMLRFDGVRYVRLPEIDEKLRSSSILSLVAGRDGSLWIGTKGGLSRWASHELFNYPDVTSWVYSILEDREGRIWFTSADVNKDHAAAFCLVIGQGTKCYGKADGVLMQDGIALAQDAEGNLWSSDPNAAVQWKPGSFKIYKSETSKSKGVIKGVRAIAPTSAGLLWIGIGEPGTGLGLQQLNQNKWKPFVTSRFNSSSLAIISLLLDRNGALWIGTAGQGLYRIRGQKVDRIRQAEGLSGDAVIKIYEDREGILWVATTKGIDCFYQLAVTEFRGPEGPGAEEADGVLSSRNGTLWVSRPGSLDALREDKLLSIRSGRGLPGKQVTSLLEDHRGRLWVGIDRTLSIYQNGSFHSIHRADGRLLGLVLGLAEDVDNNVWAEVVGPPRTLFRIRDLQVKEEFPVPRMPAARKIAADPQGGIWLGLIDGGLARYRNGHIEIFTFPHDKPEAAVEQLTVSPDGTVWGATQSGLIAWKHGKQQTLTVGNGLPCDSVFAHVFDSHDSLWLYTGCGLIEITRAELQRWWQQPNVKLQTRILDVFDGVRAGASYFNGAARTPDGRLWFVNSTELQMIDPAQLGNNLLAPPVRIEQLIADRKSYSTLEEVRLPPLTREMEINYTGLSFVAPQKVRFRYKLEDHDADWQEPGTRRQAFYTDLRPGKYRFRVIACNNDGIWNKEGATLNFSIEPAWFQTNWFRMSCIAAFSLLVWSLHRLRLSQMAQKFNTMVEGRVAERTRIARELHDTLLQGFHGLMFRFQAARNMLPRRPEEAMEALDVAITRTEQALAESRDAIKDLRSAPRMQSDITELITAKVQELASSQEADHRSPVFSVTLEGRPRPLSPFVQEEACRIAHEVLLNAFRHGEANRIEAEIRYDRRCLRLRFRDDGKGIGPEILKVGGRAGHWGLPGIRERAQRIGARVDFWSEAGAGTEIQLVVPAFVAYEKSSERAGFAFTRWWKNREQRS